MKTAILLLLLVLSSGSVFADSSSREINTTVQVTVISRAIVNLLSFNISQAAVVQGRTITFSLSFDNNGNSATNVTNNVSLIQGNTTVAQFQFNPILILNGENVSATKTVTIYANPGQYDVSVRGTYDSYATNTLLGNLTVVPRPPEESVFRPAAPPPEVPVITYSPTANGEKISVSLFPAGTEVRMLPPVESYDRTATTGIFATMGIDFRGATITVSQVGDAFPAGVPNPPITSFKRLSVETSNIDSSQIVDFTMFLRVPKDWRGGSFDKGAVVLTQYINGAWVTLPTSLVDSDSSFYYYAAITQGPKASPSYFTIGAQTALPFQVTNYPIVTETMAGKLITQTFVVQNPSSKSISGTASLSGIDSAWTVDTKKDVSIDPFSTKRVSFTFLVPADVKPSERLLIAQFDFNGVASSSSTVLRIIPVPDSGVVIYREISGDVENNRTSVRINAENVGGSKANVVEFSDRMPAELVSGAAVSFFTLQKSFINGVAKYMYSLPPGEKRTDEYSINRLSDSYPVYANWFLVETSVISSKASIIKIEQISATQFAPIIGGRISVVLFNRGAEPMSVTITPSLPADWMVSPKELYSTMPPRESVTYTFDVTLPPDTLVGTYSLRVAVQSLDGSIEQAIPLVVLQSPGMAQVSIGALAVSPLTIMISAIVIVLAISVTLAMFRRVPKARAKK